MISYYITNEKTETRNIVLLRVFKQDKEGQSPEIAFEKVVSNKDADQLENFLRRKFQCQN